MNASLKNLRVVSFFPWIPFEATGAWRRFESMCQYLVSQGAEVTMAFFDKGHDATLKGLSVSFLGEYPSVYSLGAYTKRMVDQDPTSEFKNFTANEINFILMYDKTTHLASPKAAPWLDSLLQTHDVVTCEYPMFAPVLSEFCKKWGKPLVVTSHDIMFELHGTAPAAKAKLRQFELSALALADERVYLNDDERQTFTDLGLPGVTSLGTGDAQAVVPGGEAEARHMIRQGLNLKQSDYCLFVGSAHGPNVAAAAEVKRLAKTMPKLAFIVVGACHPVVTEDNFVALGLVNDAILDSLYRGALAVVIPMLRGTGISVKAFQAFSYGKAVVSTTLGIRGYPAVHEKHFLHAATPNDIATGLRRLQNEDGLRQSLERGARELALQYDYRNEMQPYRDILLRLTGRLASTEEPAPRQLLLVDNQLADEVGHHLNYATSLRQACDEASVGFQALISARASDSICEKVVGVRTFEQSLHEGNQANPYPAEWSNLRRTYDFLLSNDHFSKELEKGLSGKARPGDLVFLPNATHGQILGLALLLQNSPIFKTLKFLIVLRYTLQVATGPLAARRAIPDKEAMERYAVSLERLTGQGRAGCVRVATDSAELAKEFAPYCKVPVEVLPIPHTVPHVRAELPAGIPAKDPKKLRIVFLGDAREEKGFEFLPAIAKALAASRDVARLELVFQAYVSSPYHKRMWIPIEQMEKMKMPNLHLVQSALSSDAYEALLQSADLVLLPYDAVTYKARTSGPFVEAICAGKPVVIPKQSWMSGMLGQSLAGVTFQSGNVQELVKMVLGAVANLPVHAAAAEELGRQFRSYHNPENFLNALLGEKRQVAEPVLER